MAMLPTTSQIENAVGVDVIGPDGSRLIFDKAHKQSKWTVQADFSYHDADTGFGVVSLFRSVEMKIYLDGGSFGSISYPHGCQIAYCKRHKRICITPFWGR